MPLAIPVANPGTNGSNMRYWIGPGSGLIRGERGWTDGTYWYDDNGLSLDRPDIPVPGLGPANESERYDVYSGRSPLGDPRRRLAPPPPAPPQYDLSNDVVETPARNPNRVPDAQNPAAVRYALRRLAQLRALGYDFDIVENDPTATWRNASLGVLEAARAAGYANPRDWLAGRPKPRPVWPVPSDFYESDAVRDPVELSRPRPGRAGPSRPAMPRGRRSVPDAVQRAVRARPKLKRAPAKPVRRGRPVRAV